MTDDNESRIMYEKSHFYAYRISHHRIEIRKNVGTHSEVLGTVSTKDRAVRFIDRAALYPNNF